MSKKFFRHWTMLRHVPIYPKRTTTGVLQEVLKDAGYEISRRTIQRDLNGLAAVIPDLQVDGNKDIPGWFWARESRLRELPAMDTNVALTFGLADQFFTTMFPPTVLGRLRPYFDSAGKVLQEVGNDGYSGWGDKVRILPRTQPLIPAEVADGTMEVIYEALFSGKQFRGRYTRRDGDEAEYDIHPLGLIFRESVVYLVATIWKYQDLRHLALHRFTRCDLLEEDAVQPDGFELDRYVQEGSFEYCEYEEETIRLKAVFEYGAGQHLFETPLSEDQQISETEDGELEVKATVKNSSQLRWWLLGFGSYVVVMEPGELREELKEIVSEMFENYFSP